MKKHDFKLFKEAKLTIPKTIKILVDIGYQGIQKIVSNSEIPHKKSMKKKPLTKEQKKENRLISKIRVIVENVFAILKKFKVISEKYRNRRKRFALRFNLIPGIHNLEISYS